MTSSLADVLFVDPGEFRTDPDAVRNDTSDDDLDSGYGEEVPPDFPTGGTPIDNLGDDVLRCEECGLPNEEYSGRGRKPKRHKACRATTGASAPRESTSRRFGKSRQEKLAYDLMEGMGQMAAGLGMFAPVTSATLALRAQNIAGSLVTIAQDNPALMAGLEKATMALPYMDLGVSAGALVYAAGVDAGRLTPFGLVPEMLGVTEAAKRVNWTPPQYEEEPAGFDGEFVDTSEPLQTQHNVIRTPKARPPEFTLK